MKGVKRVVCLVLVVAMMLSVCCYAEIPIFTYEEFASALEDRRIIQLYLKAMAIWSSDKQQYDIVAERDDGSYDSFDGDGWFFTKDEYNDLDDAVRFAIDNSQPFLMKLWKSKGAVRLLGVEAYNPVTDPRGTLAPIATLAPTATPTPKNTAKPRSLSDALNEWHQDVMEYKFLYDDTAKIRDSVWTLTEELHKQISASSHVSDVAVMLYCSYMRTWLQLDSMASMQNCIFLDLGEDVVKTEIKINEAFEMALDDYYARWENGEYTNEEVVDAIWTVFSVMGAMK